MGCMGRAVTFPPQALQAPLHSSASRAACDPAGGWRVRLRVRDALPLSRLIHLPLILHLADNIGEYTDCPVFDGLYPFCQAYSGGSIDGAVRLNNGQAGACYLTGAARVGSGWAV